jgi:hypothetical protein
MPEVVGICRASVQPNLCFSARHRRRLREEQPLAQTGVKWNEANLGAARG